MSPIYMTEEDLFSHAHGVSIMQTIIIVFFYAVLCDSAVTLLPLLLCPPSL